MNRTVVVCLRGKADASPTALNVAHGLASVGQRVVCLCDDVAPSNETAMRENGIELIKLHEEWRHPRSAAAKFRDYLGFRRAAWKAIERLPRQSTLLWIARIDTARALGSRLRKWDYILAAHELHDAFPAYQKALRFYCRNASKVVACESTRAAIMRVWYELKETPFVVPNKPLTHPRIRNLPVSDPAAKRAIERLDNGCKLLLYQGALTGDRTLTPLAETASRLRGFTLVLMGRDSENRIPELKRICPSIVHVPWVMPPAHLEITSRAHIGLAAYDYDCLNSVFCAPNKIWEYTGFGIPMVCQDVPGLINTIGAGGAGICVPLETPEDIIRAVREIDLRYPAYCERASAFYESVDLHERFVSLFDSIDSRSQDRLPEPEYRQRTGYGSMRRCG